MLKVTGIRYENNPDAASSIANGQPSQAFLATIASEIKDKARSIFLENVRHTHPTTPPPYADSFFVKKQGTSKGKDFTGFIIGNSDPVSVLVEYGAHPGGNQDVSVLGYSPLRRALDAAASNSGRAYAGPSK